MRPTVRLRHALENASRVSVVGTFNEWQPGVTPLAPEGDGTWSAVLDLAPGRYEYRLVVDGEWIDPPGAGETVANPFGSRNAVLHVFSGS